MEKITQKHPTASILIAGSRLLERGSYYGLRALIVLYMIGETINMESSEALEFYGWMSAALLLSKIIGAVIGDLVKGNKITAIIGLFLQSAGAFLLCIPSTIGLYAGLISMIFGSGLYDPNIIATFGKNYLSKSKLIDAGYTILYMAANIGAFFGVLCFGLMSEDIGYHSTFMLIGVTFLISAIPLLALKNSKSHDIQDETIDSLEDFVIEAEKPIKKKITAVVIAFILVGLFWSLYEIHSINSFEIQMKFVGFLDSNFPMLKWENLTGIITIILCVVLIFIWSVYYSSRIFKLMLGYFFGSLSFLVLFLIPDVPGSQHLIIYLLSLLLLGLSEVHISPIIHSVLTLNSNPKYLATLISVSFIPIRIFTFLLAFFRDDIYRTPFLALIAGFIVMTTVSASLFALYKTKKLVDL